MCHHVVLFNIAKYLHLLGIELCREQGIYGQETFKTDKLNCKFYRTKKKEVYVRKTGMRINFYMYFSCKNY